MSKKLQYISLGNNVSLESILELQRKICSFYRQYPGVNCMYSFSPKPTITLGSYHRDNKLHPSLNSPVMKQEAGEQRTQEIATYLRDKLDNEISVLNNSNQRPGGSTYNGPGQLSFFFNLDLTQESIHFDELKKVLDESMIETLKSYRNDLNFNYKKQIDIFTTIEGTDYKIASQGFKVSTNESKVEHTRYGVTFHLSQDSIKPFDSWILPCGVEPHEGKAIALEQLIEEPVNQELFENKFLEIFSSKLGFEVDSTNIIGDVIKKEFEEIERKLKLK